MSHKRKDKKSNPGEMSLANVAFSLSREISNEYGIYIKPAVVTHAITQVSIKLEIKDPNHPDVRAYAKNMLLEFKGKSLKEPIIVSKETANKVIAKDIKLSKEKGIPIEEAPIVETQEEPKIEPAPSGTTVGCEDTINQPLKEEFMENKENKENKKMDGISEAWKKFSDKMVDRGTSLKENVIQAATAIFDLLMNVLKGLFEVLGGAFALTIGAGVSLVRLFKSEDKAPAAAPAQA